MRTEVKMPNLGGEDTNKMVAWLKQVGDTVERGEALAEVETDKATVEMEALTSGTLVEIVAQIGDDVPVGDIIAYIE
jgi:pyruvate/2-oxoglutarate dehydrogenase complex dihydrolipoamide acyltransferase (E2) component